jgi:two-component sensor histidine kinase
MGRLRNISIKGKLTMIIMLTSSVALLLASVAFLTYDWISSRQALARHLDTLVEVIVFNSAAALAFDNVQDATETLAALRAEPHIVSACVYTEDETVFTRYHRDNLDFVPPAPETDTYRFENDFLVMFQSIVLDEEKIGTLYIQSDLQEMQDRLTNFGRIVVLSILGCSFVAFLVGSKLRQVISDPILYLAQQMKVVSEEKNYSVRAQRHSQDELGLLIEGFNDMLSQIQDRDVALQNAYDGLETRGRELQIELVERERAEAQIKDSLQEKEVLLQEIHHRVKNNLQVISSLLDLQSEYMEDERSIEMLRESRNRVRSMALIHESLYHSEDLAQIDFAEYIQVLSSNLLSSYAIQAADIQLQTNVSDIALTVDTAIPCGLVINELVSNAMKYAFPEGRKGEINIDLHKDVEGPFVLVVQDNGVGFPAEADFRQTSTLGLRLVNTLVKQLRGTIELERQDGTRFEITFTPLN